MFRWLFGGGHTVDPKQARSLIASGAVLIDVRTPEEFAAGHARGSRNIPLQRIDSAVGELKKLGKPVVLVCASGNRSGRATAFLRQQGIEAYNSGSWTNLN
jgi:rhodanese-related sulfurtransferase